VVIQHLQQRPDHGSLEMVPDERPSARVQAETERHPECHR
jgi:hypothetical protein